MGDGYHSNMIEYTCAFFYNEDMKNSVTETIVSIYKYGKDTTWKTYAKKFTQATLPRLPKNKTMKIGCIGSGFIMAECQLRLTEKWILCIWNCFEDLWECKKLGSGIKFQMFIRRSKN